MTTDLRPQEQLLEGETVRWLEHGTGSPVVLVHGIPTSPRLWRHVLPLVRGRSRAWEMTGYGTSIADGEGRDLGLTAQAERLLRWLAALDIAVCYDSWPIPSVRAMRRTARMLRHLPQTALYPSFVQLIHRGHDDRQRALESIGEHWQHYVTHGAARSLMRQVSALDARNTMAVSDRLPFLGLPARVVWGTADQFQKLEYGERLAADLGTSLTPVEGGKHFTPEDHPEVVAAAINELLPTGHSLPTEEHP